MLKNIFLEIEYLGTNYFGFQIQKKRGKKEITVQACIEEALMKLFKKKIRVVCAGRTDKGVHAKGQVVNFRVDTQILFENIKRALNSFLPSDIRIKKIKKVSPDFHARFWAKTKVYRYLIYNRKEPSVFWRDFSWHIETPLDLSFLRKTSQQFIGRKDFFNFAKEAKKYKDCIREIKDISIKKRGKFIQIDIEANGFLRNMARNIVRFLVNLSCGKTPPTNKPAPAYGLYLLKVKYD